MFLLLFRRPNPVADPLSADEVKTMAENFQSKVQDLEFLHQRGEAGSFHFTAEEINAALQRGLAEQLAASKNGAPKGEAVSPELPPGVQATQVALEADHAKIQIVTQLLGRNVYLTLTTKIGAADGHITLEVLDGKIGNLSIPITVLKSQLKKKMEDPEAREKLKLPDYVTGLQIENGQLVVSVK
jgi:hypothetical protein